MHFLYAFSGDRLGDSLINAMGHSAMWFFCRRRRHFGRETNEWRRFLHLVLSVHFHSEFDCIFSIFSHFPNDFYHSCFECYLWAWLMCVSTPCTQISLSPGAHSFFSIIVGTKNVSRIFLLNLPVRLLLLFFSAIGSLFSSVQKIVCVFLGQSRTILCESNSNSRLGRLRNCSSIDVTGVRTHSNRSLLIVFKLKSCWCA